MSRRTCCFVAILASWLSAASRIDAQWPQFRGPEGNGVSSATALALTWSEGNHVRWKVPIHGRGWSSPVILGSQVWLTTATPDGHALSAVALDKTSGKILFDLPVFKVDRPQPVHPFNSYASPTPVIEPGRLYVSFGSAGTAAIDTQSGEVIWKRNDLECDHFRGPGSSPIVFAELLIMHFDGINVQYVVALDKKTGKTVWRTNRSVDFQDVGPDGKAQGDGDFRKGFGTPQVVMVGDRPVLVSLGSKALYAYDPRTGQELWRIVDRSAHSPSTRPLVGHGLVFYLTGWSGSLVAVKPDGRGDVTGTHVVWRVTRGVPNKPSAILAGDLLFMINDGGILSCLEAQTGKSVWQSRLQGEYSASPLFASGRVYFFSEEGKTTVIDSGRQFKVLAENQLGDGYMASAAVDGNALILRSRTHVYRIE
jgi:outer membrane protein assembly factor BamB